MFPAVAYVCDCTHRRGRHFFSTRTPLGPCRDCTCTAFKPEPKCKCSHGKKRHDKPGGKCHECGCPGFRPA